MLDHLFSVCNSLSKLLDPGHGQLPQYSIHNLACNLLAALAVIGAPLETLYRYQVPQLCEQGLKQLLSLSCTELSVASYHYLLLIIIICS